MVQNISLRSGSGKQKVEKINDRHGGAYLVETKGLRVQGLHLHQPFPTCGSRPLWEVK